MSTEIFCFSHSEDELGEVRDTLGGEQSEQSRPERPTVIWVKYMNGIWMRNNLGWLNYIQITGNSAIFL